mmetsp:Transcript_36175/g.94824  ORF Transcript_36175/g.94824 Transcript_36175/m.94824 type:complete len:322 (+) Transcript_36175:78-1043(+)
MSILGNVKGAVQVVLLAVVLRFGIDVLFQPTFPVHSSGGVVLTGASSGIGREAAGALHSLGYTVFAGVRKQKDGDSLEKAFPGIRPVIVDVTSQESIASAVDTVAASLKADGLKLVALVNNAGVQKDMPLELQPADANRFNFEVNVFGLFDVTRAFLPMLRATGRGARIVNVGSMAGLLAAPGSASYSGSKFAVEGITDSLRMEVLDMGISVSLLQPGYVKSEMGPKLHSISDQNYGVGPEDYARYAKRVFEGFFAKDKKLAHDGMPPSETTTPAIIDAVRSPTPKTRYPVAYIDDFPAWLFVYIKAVLPDRVMDILTLEI